MQQYTKNNTAYGASDFKQTSKKIKIMAENKLI